MDNQQFTELLAILQSIDASLRVIAAHVEPEAFHQDERETDSAPGARLVMPQGPLRPQDELPQNYESGVEIDRPR